MEKENISSNVNPIDSDKTPLNTPKTPKNTLKTGKKHEKTLKNTNYNKLTKPEKEEKFAQALLTAPSQTVAYKEAFGTTNDVTARVNASKLLTNSNVKQRVRELLESRRSTSLERLTERLGEHVEDKDGSLSLKSIDLSMKLYGALDNDGMNNTEPADININIIANSNVTNELRQDAN